MARTNSNIIRTETHKLCSRCKQMKPYEQFCKNRRQKDGLDYWCKPCVRVYAESIKKEPRYRERRKELWHSKPHDHPSKLRKKASSRRRRRAWQYNISQHILDAVLATQNNRCGICEVPFAELTSKAMQLDHCHATNVFRGFLCVSCNHLLGNAKDDPKRLRAAIEYLDRAANSPYIVENALDPSSP